MRVLVTGAGGQLGSDVCKRLANEGIEYKGIDRTDYDLTISKEVSRAFNDYQPTVVIHCAAYTSVDNAEKEIDICRKTNVDATYYIANESKKNHCKMMYISTDYVFDGQGNVPFEVNDPHAPLNIYGKTKAEGEVIVKATLREHYIVRVSWVFGSKGKNFVKTMISLGANNREISVVDDQIGSPTYTEDLALLLCSMIKTEKYGTYHATNEGFCSWAEFASEIMKLMRFDCKIIPVSSSNYKTLAKRPSNSRMSKASLDSSGFRRLPHWKNALKRGISIMT